MCVERASLAKQPARVPDPATPQRPAGQGPESAPVAQSRPAAPRAERPVRGEPANSGHASRPAGRPARPSPAGPKPAGAPKADPRSPVAQSRPAHRPPAEHGAPVDRGKPAHVPREHPQGHSRGPQKPVGQDPVRPHPEKPVDRGPVSHPDQQPTPNRSRRSRSTSPRATHKGILRVARTRASRGVRDLTASRASREARRAKRIPLRRETVWRKRQRSRKCTPGRVRPRITDPTRAATYRPRSGRGPRAGVPDTRTRPQRAAGAPPSGTGMAQHPDRRAASAVLPGHETGSGTRSTEELSRRPAKAAADTPAPLPTAVRREDAVRPAGDPLCRTNKSPGTRGPSRRLLLPRPRAESGHRLDTVCGRRRRRP